MEQCKKGDREAYGELVRRHQDRLFNLIYRSVGDFEQARDIAQDVFVRAFRGIAAFHGRSAFYTWLYRIAVNEVISHRRRGGSSRRIHLVSLTKDDEESGRKGLEDPPDTSAEPSSLLDRREREERIQEAINSLDEEHRMVVLLKDVEGYRYEEIAEIIGCPPGTVKSRLHRARQELREKLRPLLPVAEGAVVASGDSK